MKKTIAIAGMGWLGVPFAQHLMTLGYKVKGSVTSIKKASKLQKTGFNAFPLEISEAGVRGEVSAFFKDAACLVIMIPPGLRRNTGANHVLKMTHFLTEIEKSEVKKVILVSSTSVYDDHQGNVTEKDIPKPKSEAGKQLVQVEQLFFNAPFIETTIVRFGGLFGGNRQPVTYLAGRKELRGGNAPVNLIHRDDCIQILTEIIKQEAFGRIFNAVTPQHPVKEVYYSKMAKKLQLEMPQFKTEVTNTTFKQVDSVNLGAVLQYEFIHSL